MFGSSVQEVIVGFIFLSIILGVFYYLNKLSKKHIKFSYRVFISLVIAIVLGIIMNFLINNMSLFRAFDSSGKIVSDYTGVGKSWLTLFGYGFVDLLRMISLPLIFVSIFGAVIKLNTGKGIVKVVGTTMAALLATTAIAAVVGILVTKGFGLNATQIIGVDLNSVDCSEVITAGTSGGYSSELIEICNYGNNRAAKVGSTTNLPNMLRGFIPKNPIYALTGQATNSTFKVVVFAFLLGIAFLGVKRKKPEEGETIEKGFDGLHALISRLTAIVLKLTPYGIFALMFRVFAFTGWVTILPLAKYLVATWVAIGIMFVIHGIILFFNGTNPITFYKKAAKTLLFAFTSRSSAGTLPLTISTLKDQFGVTEEVSTTSASFGTTIGQNGCAGIYPAMLVTMVWATGVIPDITIFSYVFLVIIVTLTSLGIAGIGGGATFAAVAVFSAIGLDDWLWLTGILVSIEALIDMGRTALNVNGAMVSGLVTAKVTDSIDIDVYNNMNTDNNVGFDKI